KDVVEAIDAMGLSRFTALDLTIARGLDYYTGTVFETILDDLASVGSVMSGGRYDSLLEMFGVKDVPAVGISIGVDRLLTALAELGNEPQVHCGPVAVCCPMGREATMFLLGTLPLLRAAGVRSEMVPETTWRMKKQLQFASRSGARFALIAGDSEVSEGTITLKDLKEGTQTQVPSKDVVNAVTKALDLEDPGGG
ncbi:MAG: histidine--tRNA ligase, partial [Deltaproteobacteria bacterium]|nr:histidine--tRNA ligase [Deltaproteobacteria bacterium]